MIKITKEAGCWIQYQLKLNNLTHYAVAKKANRNSRTVSDFLRGRKGSKVIPNTLSEILGYENFKALLDAIPKESFEPIPEGSV